MRRGPTFYPAISMDKVSWAWTRGVETEGLLVSYDVLNQASLSHAPGIKSFLGFQGKVILDSGAFGLARETNPLRVHDTQLRLRPDIAILLDKIPAQGASPAQQERDVRETIANAAAIAARHGKRRMKLMAVVQGDTPALRAFCSSELARLGYTLIGIPLSDLSRTRQYVAGLEKTLAIQELFPTGTVFHALGSGSRTMIAILSAAGIRSFDSSASYKAAIKGEAVSPVSVCSIGKANTKPECAGCLATTRTPRSPAAKADHNLREILKEIQRCRCAIQENKMTTYLQAKLTKPVCAEVFDRLKLPRP
jgi:tRNA-guanine family transglycosylase